LNEILFPVEKTQKYVDIFVKIFLNFTTIYGVNTYLKKDADYELCCRKFLNSDMFISNKDYIRYQLIRCFNTFTFCIGFCSLMLSSFQSLIITVWKHFQKFPELHRLGFKMLYEMCREYNFTSSELLFIHKEFLCFILELLEKNTCNDDYIFSITKLILLINEQYIIKSLPSHLQDSHELSKQTKNSFPLYQTYLRVFYYLLKNTQLKNPPYYKQDQLRRLFKTLKETATYQNEKSISDVTEKLLQRCINISWIKDCELENNIIFSNNWNAPNSIVDVITTNNDYIFDDSNKLHTI
ncbi:hypothetical protein PORY_001850, partial [Pneumocystis oryctolagi]